MKAEQPQPQTDRERIDYWKNLFKPRTIKWQNETLRRLKSKVSIFETAEDNAHKIYALKELKFER